MKQKVSYTIEKELIQHLRKQRIMHSCSSDSQFMEWILRQVLYKPKELLKLRARNYASKIAFIQDQIKDLDEMTIKVTRQKEITEEFLIN